MISDLSALFSGALSVMKIPITIYGFTFSFWTVLLWSLLAGIIIWFIGRVFSD